VLYVFYCHLFGAEVLFCGLAAHLKNNKYMRLCLPSTGLCSFNSYVGIKELVFGGSEFKNWKENLTSEYAGYSVHKI
jgi:hypothetical protein